MLNLDNCFFFRDLFLGKRYGHRYNVGLSPANTNHKDTALGLNLHSDGHSLCLSLSFFTSHNNFPSLLLLGSCQRSLHLSLEETVVCDVKDRTDRRLVSYY